MRLSYFQAEAAILKGGEPRGRNNTHFHIANRGQISDYIITWRALARASANAEFWSDDELDEGGATAE